MADENTTRDGFGQGLLEAAQEDAQIVGLCADLTESTRMHWFAKSFPNRYVELGVAEQNLAGVAAGLALTGKHPVAASYATFSPANNWGPIRSSICYSNLPVTLVGGHSGIAIGPDGATHQGLEDIALMRVLPNMTVVVPADKEEARKAIRALCNVRGPSYLRTTKFATPAVTDAHTPFSIGKAVVLREGRDSTIIACGIMVHTALEVAKHLSKQGISVEVINMHTIKPIDKTAIKRAFKQTKLVVTLEDHQVAGGLGSAVAEVAVTLGSGTPQLLLGIQDKFGESGSATDLLTAYKLDPKSVALAIQQAVTQQQS